MAVSRYSTRADVSPCVPWCPAPSLGHGRYWIKEGSWGWEVGEVKNGAQLGFQNRCTGSQTGHKARIWPRMDVACSGWIGIPSWSGRWQVRAVCLAGACGWQCQQRLSVVGSNLSEGFQSLLVTIPTLLWRPEKRTQLFYGRWSNGHCFLSINCAQDTG